MPRWSTSAAELDKSHAVMDGIVLSLAGTLRVVEINGHTTVGKVASLFAQLSEGKTSRVAHFLLKYDGGERWIDALDVVSVTKLPNTAVWP